MRFAVSAPRPVILVLLLVALRPGDAGNLACGGHSDCDLCDTGNYNCWYLRGTQTCTSMAGGTNSVGYNVGSGAFAVEL